MEDKDNEDNPTEEEEEEEAEEEEDKEEEEEEAKNDKKCPIKKTKDKGEKEKKKAKNTKTSAKNDKKCPIKKTKDKGGESKKQAKKTKTSQVAKKKIKEIDSKGSQVKKKIKKKDGVQPESGVTAKESGVKKSIKKADAKEVLKGVVNVDSIESNPEESALMKKIDADDLKQKLAQTFSLPMTMRSNAKHLEVHVSRPFQNNKFGKSHWIVVLGDNGQTWLIKPEFVTGYLQCLLSEIETTNIDIGHCETYYEINIRQHEFGSDSIWKRVQKNNGRLP